MAPGIQLRQCSISFADSEVGFDVGRRLWEILIDNDTSRTMTDLSLIYGLPEIAGHQDGFFRRGDSDFVQRFQSARVSPVTFVLHQ
jgi:predicted ATP-grasp superfamily ATP-dependent carboligase